MWLVVLFCKNNYSTVEKFVVKKAYPSKYDRKPCKISHNEYKEEAQLKTLAKHLSIFYFLKTILSNLRKLKLQITKAFAFSTLVLPQKPQIKTT